MFSIYIINMDKKERVNLTYLKLRVDIASLDSKEHVNFWKSWAHILITEQSCTLCQTAVLPLWLTGTSTVLFSIEALEILIIWCGDANSQFMLSQQLSCLLSILINLWIILINLIIRYCVQHGEANLKVWHFMPPSVNYPYRL